MEKHDVLIGQEFGRIIRIPVSFGLKLHEFLKIHTPLPFSLRGRTGGYYFKGRTASYGATRLTFSEFSFPVLLSGERPVFNGDLFGIP